MILIYDNNIQVIMTTITLNHLFLSHSKMPIEGLNTIVSNEIEMWALNFCKLNLWKKIKELKYFFKKMQRREHNEHDSSYISRHIH